MGYDLPGTYNRVIFVGPLIQQYLFYGNRGCGVACCPPHILDYGWIRCVFVMWLFFIRACRAAVTLSLECVRFLLHPCQTSRRRFKSLARVFGLTCVPWGTEVRLVMLHSLTQCARVLTFLMYTVSFVSAAGCQAALYYSDDCGDAESKATALATVSKCM